MIFINRIFIKKLRIKKISPAIVKGNDIFFFSGRKYVYGYRTYLLKIFKDIFGISIKRFIKFFSSRFGFSINSSLMLVDVLVFQKLQLIFQKLIVNYELKKMIDMNIKIKRQLKTYQGVRALLYLPIRGQRSKTNAQSSKTIRRNLAKRNTKRQRKRGGKKHNKK